MLLIPYNENLPSQRAHDVYLMHQAWFLGRYLREQNKKGQEVVFLTGHSKIDPQQLVEHYLSQEASAAPRDHQSP